MHFSLIYVPHTEKKPITDRMTQNFHCSSVKFNRIVHENEFAHQYDFIYYITHNKYTRMWHMKQHTLVNPITLYKQRKCGLFFVFIQYKTAVRVKVINFVYILVDMCMCVCVFVTRHVTRLSLANLSFHFHSHDIYLKSRIMGDVKSY